MPRRNPDLGLVLMDVDLPGAWGEQLVRVVHGLDQLAEVPILVASAPRSQVELMRPARERRTPVVSVARPRSVSCRK
jgi:CheY-like chemotaxis protein